MRLTISLFLALSVPSYAEDSVLDLIVPIIAAISGNSVPESNNDQWGASRISESQRPTRNWLKQFDGVTPIDVPTDETTIEAALNKCTTEYCVVRINQLQLTSTAYLDRDKTKLIGSAGNRISYASNISHPDAFIAIESGASQIVIQNLNIDGQSKAYGNSAVFGLMISGQNINHIALLDNEIHGLNSNEDAHGIAVYGSGNSEANAIQHIIISGNDVHDMRTGSSESIVINGNVKNWEISNNTVHQVNNIAIDAIGGEGTSPVTVVNGRTLPGPLDAARFGFIENNSVTNMSTLGNPAYDNLHSWAGAIYIDGARDILIANNTVNNAEWAYDIGAENCVSPNNIVLENNFAAGSYYGDFLIGGYAEQGYKDDPTINCNPLNSIDDDEGHGYVENVTIRHNQFTTLNPIDDQGRINLLYRIRQSIIIEAGVSADHPNGVVRGDQNSIRTSQ